MGKLIDAPTRIPAAGNLAKLIDEYVGHANTGNADVSIAHMRSPAGWEEPGQRPEFHEFTIVLKGVMRIELTDGVVEVKAGQAYHAEPGDWVRYSTPSEDGAEYIAVCMPAFSPDTVHRDE